MKNFVFIFRNIVVSAAFVSVLLPAYTMAKADEVVTQQFCKAASIGRLAEIKDFVTRGIDVNNQDATGNTPLHYAVQSDSPEKEEIMRFLLKHGADIYVKNTRGLTPLDGLSPQTLSKLLETIAVKTDESFNAEISYLFADIKFDVTSKGPVLKILELGEGKNGGYRTWDGVFEVGKIWAGFWNYLKQFDIPMIYVGRLPSSKPINKLGITLQDKIAWKDFEKYGGVPFPSLRSLEKSDFFKLLLKSDKQFDPCSIRSYKGVLVYKYRDDREPKHLRELESFKKRFPDILVIDEVSRPYAASKELTDILFDEEGLREYRPKTRVYEKRYSRKLARTINNEFSCNKYVIKPLNSGMSNGVVVVPRKKLDKALKRITARTTSINHGTYNYRPTTTMTWGYWKGDVNSGFLVEEYVPSKLLEINGKIYDPTMRVTFVVHNDNGCISVNFLESWWKIPTHSIHDNCTLTERHVSKFRGDLKKLPREKMRVVDEDMAQIKIILRDVLPKMYLKMLMIKKELKVS